MLSYLILPEAGKRLIGQAVAKSLIDDPAMSSGMIVILAGSTNAYVAEELLLATDQAEGFSKVGFVRGITAPPHVPTDEKGRLTDQGTFPGDVVLKDGKLLQNKTIDDVIDKLKQGDIIVKGANSVILGTNKAGILIGHPEGGTILQSLKAVVGRRVRLILPVGLEKRVTDDIDATAQKVNHPHAKGLRLLSVSGEVVTEIEALAMLFQIRASLIAAGGVAGAQGASWLFLEGDADKINTAKDHLDTIAGEKDIWAVGQK